VLNRRALLRIVAPLLFMGVIFYFSAQPSSGEHPWWELVFRKLGHVFGYAVLTTLWWWALHHLVRRPLLIAVSITFAYACSDEFHQTFVSGRTGSPIDVGVDAIGMATAALLISTRRLPLMGRGRVDARGGASRSSLARSP